MCSPQKPLPLATPTSLSTLVACGASPLHDSSLESESRISHNGERLEPASLSLSSDLSQSDLLLLKMFVEQKNASSLSVDQ